MSSAGSAQKLNKNKKMKNGVTVTYDAFPLRALQVAFGNVGNVCLYAYPMALTCFL